MGNKKKDKNPSGKNEKGPITAALILRIGRFKVNLFIRYQ